MDDLTGTRLEPDQARGGRSARRPRAWRSWRVQHSPANRVPSHGTEAFGSSYAIDLVPVDDRGRSAPRTWRSLVATEPPEFFVGFGRPILAPVNGVVVHVHDGEPDHEARRSQLSLVRYMLRQRDRAVRGAPGLAGNHVVITMGVEGPFVLLAHLRRGSVQVQPGQKIPAGLPVARCGNSGNSTEPHLHLHLQVSDSMNWTGGHGLLFTFRAEDGTTWLPKNADVVHSEASRRPAGGRLPMRKESTSLGDLDAAA